MTLNPLYSLAGVLVGLLVGMTGVGGGSLMTPLLVLVFGFHPATAVGTDLLYASVTKTVGTGVHGWRGTVDWRIVRRLAAGSMPAALVTLLILARMGERTSETGQLIAVMLGIALVLTSIATLFRQKVVGWLTERLGTATGRRLTGWTVLLGMVLGVLVSLTSVGAGALGMTALLVLYPRHPLKSLVGSDIAHAVPLTLVAGAGHWLLGSLDDTVVSVGLRRAITPGRPSARVFGTVVVVVFIGAGLLSTVAGATMALSAIGDVSTLAETTVLLLLLVFLSANVSVLVLKKDRVAHDHFTVPRVVPVLAIIASVVLLAQQTGIVWLATGGYIVVGSILFLLARIGRKREAGTGA